MKVKTTDGFEYTLADKKMLETPTSKKNNNSRGYWLWRDELKKVLRSRGYLNYHYGEYEDAVGVYGSYNGGLEIGCMNFGPEDAKKIRAWARAAVAKRKAA